MLRPAAGQPERYVDATNCAHAKIKLQREFALDALPRLREAGAIEPTVIAVDLQFVHTAQKPAIHGTLTGRLELVCQRCLGPVGVPLQESFKVIILADEAALEQEFEDYEPIVADPARLDLNAVAEEQGLLAMPLVARHEPGECGQQSTAARDHTDTQRPFGNLRDLMRGR
jgi:uncharacterized protein